MRDFTTASAPAPREFLRQGEAKPPPSDAVDQSPVQKRARRGRARRLLCASCSAPITTLAARTEITGAHEHHFVNPHGHDFHIGCFARAPGVLPLGAATLHFSWFPGAPWRVGVCGGCRLHLGWAYGVPVEFFGLILNRLRPEPDDDGRGGGE